MQIDTETAAADPWDLLGQELDAWAADGRQATLWLRDDDATQDGPRLRQLLEAMKGAPVSLAVIPNSLAGSLPTILHHYENVTVLQHGFAHVSHAEKGEKKSEFPAHRSAETVLSDLMAGRTILDAEFGPAFRKVLAPPWNRIADCHRAALQPAGLAFLSTYGDPSSPATDPTVIDTQVDPIFWRGHRGYLGDAPVLDRLCRHLATRRAAPSGSAIDRPSGIMTHHIVHDAGCWAFLSRLVDVIAGHPAAAWVDPFAPDASS